MGGTFLCTSIQSEDGSIDRQRPGLVQRGGVAHGRAAPASAAARRLSLWLLAAGRSIVLGVSSCGPTFAYRLAVRRRAPTSPSTCGGRGVGAAEGISLVGARPGRARVDRRRWPAPCTWRSSRPSAGCSTRSGQRSGAATVALVRGRSHGGPARLAARGPDRRHVRRAPCGRLRREPRVRRCRSSRQPRRLARRHAVEARSPPRSLLGGGGLSHPAVLPRGRRDPGRGGRRGVDPRARARVALRRGTGAGRARRRRRGHRRAGCCRCSLGPPRLSVDTSKDGFLRRAGLDDALLENYRSGSGRTCGRFAPWVTLAARRDRHAAGAQVHPPVPGGVGRLHGRSACRRASRRDGSRPSGS